MTLLVCCFFSDPSHFNSMHQIMSEDLINVIERCEQTTGRTNVFLTLEVESEMHFILLLSISCHGPPRCNAKLWWNKIKLNICIGKLIFSSEHTHIHITYAHHCMEIFLSTFFRCLIPSHLSYRWSTNTVFNFHLLKYFPCTTYTGHFCVWKGGGGDMYIYSDGRLKISIRKWIEWCRLTVGILCIGWHNTSPSTKNDPFYQPGNRSLIFA